MTCSMVVNSKSGNTRMVSGAIKRALQAAGVEFIHAAALSDDADPEQVAHEAEGACAADTVLVGFWCDKGACTPSVAALLSALHGKRVFLFGTCGFGASKDYFKQIIDRVSSNLAGDAELAGWAMCQGKMGPAVKQRYEAQNTSSTHTTFFVTGAFQSEEMEQELLDSGFSFFFVKPFDESVLVSRVLKAAGNTMRPQVVSQDSDELTVTEILHQIGVLRSRVHQRRDQAALSRNRQAQHDHGQPRRARDPPRHRGRLGPWRRGHAEQLLWLHDPQPARQADEQ